MKKIVSLLLVAAMAATLFAGCGKKDEGGSDKPALTGSMEEIANKIAEAQPTDIMAGVTPIDVTDTSEEGKWALSYNTGLSSADKISDAAVYEAMIGSMAFSMAVVRVKDAADAKAVAQEMSDNIDTRKWVCVEANEKMVAGYGDVVMLIMLDNQLDMSAQSYVDAFKKVCGGELDFTI